MDLSELIKQPWFAALLGALVGATLAGLINIGLAFYKTAVDKAAAIRKHKSEYHLYRKEQLAKLIALMLEFRIVASEARRVGNSLNNLIKTNKRIEEAKAKKEDYKKPYVDKDDLPPSEERFMQEYMLYYRRGKELMPQIIVTAEQYGKLPKECDGIQDRQLTRYVNDVLFGRIEDMLDISMNHNYVSDGWRHIAGFVQDFRILVDMEQDMARRVLKERNARYAKFTLPYIGYIAPNFKAFTFDPKKSVDDSFLYHPEDDE